MWPFKKKKIVNLFAIADREDRNKYYTFVTNYDEAFEYMCRLYLYLYRYEHYKMWCALRSLELSDESILQYLDDNEIDVNEKFSIDILGYEESNLATLFRIYNNCVPLGCSYETEDEKVIYYEKLKEEKPEK